MEERNKVDHYILLGMVGDTCNFSTGKVEAGKLDVMVILHYIAEFEVSFGYMKSCLQTKK